MQLPSKKLKNSHLQDSQPNQSSQQIHSDSHLQENAELPNYQQQDLALQDIEHQPQRIARLWSIQQQQKLFQLHYQLGNKWNLIASHFTNQTANSLKNRLFSSLRLTFTRLNQTYQYARLRVKKRLPNHIIHKIMSVSQEKFSQKPKYQSQYIQSALQIKKRLTFMILTKDASLKFQISLFQDIHAFNDQYRSRTRLIKNQSQKQLKSKKKSSFVLEKKMCQQFQKMNDRKAQISQFLRDEFTKKHAQSLQLKNNQLHPGHEGINSYFWDSQPIKIIPTDPQLKNQQPLDRDIDIHHSLDLQQQSS